MGLSRNLHTENISRNPPQGKSSAKQFVYSFHWNLLKNEMLTRCCWRFQHSERVEKRQKHHPHTPFSFGKKKKDLKVPIVGAFVCSQQLLFSEWFVEPRLRACLYDENRALLLELWLYFLFSFSLTLALRTHYENFHVHHRRLITCEKHISRQCIRQETLQT